MEITNGIVIAVLLTTLFDSVFSQNLLPYGSEIGDVTVTFNTGDVRVNLSYSIPIQGRKKFNTLNINKDGSISFGDPLRTSNLNEVMGNVVIYAPLLMSTKDATTREIFYRQISSGEEINNFKSIISEKLGDQNIEINNLFVATFKYTFNQTKENLYQILIGSSEKRSYVKFVYESIQVVEYNNKYARAGIFGTLEGASVCSSEISGSGTSLISKIENLTNVNENGSFIWRTDLPLECTTLVTECGDPNELSDRFNACPVDTFLETGATWSLYTFYFCKPGLTREGGGISIKRQCRYDPDYYTHEWRELNENERCTQRLANFWSAFFASSTQMTISATTLRPH